MLLLRKLRLKPSWQKAAAAAAAVAAASTNEGVAQVQSAAAAEASLPVEQYLQQPSEATPASRPMVVPAEAPVQAKQQVAAVSGSKRHHGLGFVEGQPSAKPVKGEEDIRAVTDNTAAGPQPAQAETKPPLEVTGLAWQAESSSSMQAPFPNPELHGRMLTIKVSKQPESNATGLRGRGRGLKLPARGFGEGRGDRGRSIYQQERLAVGTTSGPAFVPRTVGRKGGATGKAPTNEDFQSLLQKT